MGVLITQAEYARRRGVAKSAVARAVAEQRIRLIDGKVDPEVADIQWANNTRARGDSAKKASAAAAGGRPAQADLPGADEAPDDYKDHRTRREKAEADRAEVLSLRERQLVLMREPTERAVFEVFRGLRDTAFQAMRDVAPKVRDLTEPRQIQLVLEDELRQAFAAFEASARKRLDDLAAEARP